MMDFIAGAFLLTTAGIFLILGYLVGRDARR